MADDTQTIDPSTAPPSDVPEGMTPFSTSTTDPSGQTRTLTGYGPRRPLQPPQGQGMAMPDISEGIVQAFKNLPVEQATQAIEAATRFIGQRGYMKDIQSGKNAAEAFAKWGPMLFKTATGIPEAIDRSVPAPITPYQKAQIDLRRQSQTQMTPFQQQEIELRKKAQQNTALKPPPMPEATRLALTDSYKELDAARKEATALADQPIDDPKVWQAANKMDAAKRQIHNLTQNPLKPNKVPYKEGTKLKSKKDGKIYVVKDGVPVPVKD